jgi:hypothetical protein
VELKEKKHRNNAWFQFNDESVTEIKLSTDKTEAIVDITDDDRKKFGAFSPLFVFV